MNKKCLVLSALILAGTIMVGCTKQKKATIGSLNNNQNVSGYKITQEQAKEIALEHAKLNASDVHNLRVNKEYENGVGIYEVDFYYNLKEYNYEIDCATGDILSFELD